MEARRLMKRAIGILYCVLLLVLAIATVVESLHSADYAYNAIYGTLWFVGLWAVMFTVGCAYYIWCFVPVNSATHLLHLSFAIILIGAGVTFLFGHEGSLHLRRGQTKTTYTEKTSGMERSLPYKVRLNSFRVIHTAGTEMPSDFESHISCIGNDGNRHSAVVSMNSILEEEGFRFYQKSYDSDSQGVVLGVANDPWGTGITYTGYLLLIVSSLLILISKEGGFRRLLRQFSEMSIKGSVGILLMLFVFSKASAAKESVPTINREKADKVARMQVVYNGRLAPLNTVACDFIKKVYGKNSYKGLSPEQVLIGWSIRPDEWKKQKMIFIKDSALRNSLGLTGRYASVEDLFDGKDYKLLPLFETANVVASDNRTKGKTAISMKALQETDEKMGLVLLAAEQKLIVPAIQGAETLSSERVEAEILYNRIPATTIFFMFNLTMGFILFLLTMARGTKPKTILPVGMLVFSTIAMMAYYLLRWFIARHVPLSNGYETMLFLALSTMTLSLIGYRMARKIGRLVVAFALLLSGFMLLVAHLGQMNPQITPLMPVLKSPILSMHVSIIMIAYALLALMMCCGLYTLFLHRRVRGKDRDMDDALQQIQQLTMLNRILLYPATLFLAVGIVLGAVWANVSWGKYWSWDPKETWALITFMVYGLAFHSRSVAFLRNDKWFNLYVVAAFLTVLMTYFGVNYVLGGLHSYA